MDFLNYIPVTLELKTGRIFYEPQLRTRILHYVLFYMSVCKCAQISYALVRQLMDFEMESLHVVILTTLWLSLVGTSTYWGSEMFHRGLPETIILFNSLKYIPQENIKSDAPFINNLVSSVLTLNLQELLCVATPFLIKSFVPMYIAMMLTFPDWSIFATSLIYPYEGSWWTRGLILIGVVEVLTAFYTECNILFLFFFQLALQVTCVARMETHVDCMR